VTRYVRWAGCVCGTQRSCVAKQDALESAVYRENAVYLDRADHREYQDQADHLDHQEYQGIPVQQVRSVPLDHRARPAGILQKSESLEP